VFSELNVAVVDWLDFSSLFFDYFCYYVWQFKGTVRVLCEFFLYGENAVEKSKKPQVIDKISKSFKESEAVFVVTQNKMTVADTDDFRKQLRNVNSSYLVCKNTLARLAVKDTSFEYISPNFNGQTAIVFSKDLTATAKVVQKYAEKSEEKITVVCGGYGEKLLSSAEVVSVSRLPSMDELRSKIISIVQTPAQRIATLLQAPASQIARVVQAYSSK
jgi:large subunit ribosomal protein L10